MDESRKQWRESVWSPPDSGYKPPSGKRYNQLVYERRMQVFNRTELRRKLEQIAEDFGYAIYTTAETNEDEYFFPLFLGCQYPSAVSPTCGGDTLSPELIKINVVEDGKTMLVKIHCVFETPSEYYVPYEPKIVARELGNFFEKLYKGVEETVETPTCIGVNINISGGGNINIVGDVVGRDKNAGKQ